MKMRKLSNGKIDVVYNNGTNITFDDLHSAMEALKKRDASGDIEDYLDIIRNLDDALDKAVADVDKLSKANSKLRNENTELRAKVARLEAVIVDQAMRLAGVAK